MNRRDIFIMLFYSLDAYWDKHHSEEIGNICSGLNPFLWADESSGVPAYWTEFCALVEDVDYTVEEGFVIAKKICIYIK